MPGATAPSRRQTAKMAAHAHEGRAVATDGVGPTAPARRGPTKGAPTSRPVDFARASGSLAAATAPQGMVRVRERRAGSVGGPTRGVMSMAGRPCASGTTGTC